MIFDLISLLFLSEFHFEMMEKMIFELNHNVHFKCFCPVFNKSVNSFCVSTSCLSPCSVQWLFTRFTILLKYFGFFTTSLLHFWIDNMAYANYFNTKVTELRFRCLAWTVQLHNLNQNIEFQIYEDENNSSIDFEMVFRDNNGSNIGSIMFNNIDVSDQLVQVVQHIINIQMYTSGVQVRKNI